MRSASIRVAAFRSEPPKGAAAGFIGGLAGSWAMNGYWSILAKLAKLRAPPTGSSRRGSGGDDATVRAASAVLQRVTRHELTQEQKMVAGSTVHYAMGSVSGALYGAMAEVARGRWLGRGVSLGIALWLIADEIAVPLVGFANPPSRYPMSVHAKALGAHVVYGLTTDMVRRIVRIAL
jgi:hypothetical protein